MTDPTDRAADDAVSSSSKDLRGLRAATVVAVLRAPTAEAGILATDALVAGGVTGIEITYSTPDAAAVIREVRRRHGDAVHLGAGTVLEPRQAREAVEAGAEFLVSPGTDAELAGAMLGSGVTVLSGALTPSEVMTALRLGVHVVKLFPASLGGPAYLKALRGPFPQVDFVPTGGVNAGNLAEWLAAGAVAVGAGGELCPATAMADGDWATITANARQFSDAARRARGAQA
ncbi:2-keto-3-deoxy-phosphogluconate aldolase [Friedmanniella luteola]|uniref:2-keto-3-deoxy-phosphogluconate aldolase n=1 Tax=Friedmanniella luteola TaxID=546871 RepID=A0A1H1ZPI2_9ACTN|nr:bifunctional 4-hydroxy-2-oxoglutarate aldolase/2-dehydro-3-deoxy-phosphogluconate aldolase [Friedmanniella luteola]SDT35322.1 2-keto-3-deoxy-phosphogluconate aldolase [Friedmanniella luteola]